MPITIKHGVSADVLGESAYFAGKASRAERDLDRSREDVAGASARGLEAARISVQKQLGLASVSARRAATKEQARQFNVRAKQSQLAYEESPERELNMLEAKAQINRQQMQWGYTEGQKQEQDKLTNALNWVDSEESAGKLRPFEADQMRSQLNAQMAGINPQKLRKEGMSPQELLGTMSFPDKDGRMMFWNPSGNKTPVYMDADDMKLMQKTNADEIKAQADYNKVLLDLVNEDITEYGTIGTGRDATQGVTDVRKRTVEEAREILDSMGIENPSGRRAQQGVQITQQTVNAALQGDEGAISELAKIIEQNISKEDADAFTKGMKTATPEQKEEAIQRLLQYFGAK